MYVFEGNYRRTPQQNLAGASRVEGKTELINRAQLERKRRQEQRAKEDGAVKIQAAVRGFLCRRRHKALFTSQFDAIMKDLCNATCFSMDNIIYIIRRIPFMGITNPDVPRILIATSIVLNHKSEILKELQKSKFDWMWRLKILMRYSLLVLKLSKNCKLEFYMNSLQFVDYFTSYHYISQHINDELAKELISELFLYGVFKEYFKVGLTLLEKSHNERAGEVEFLYPINMLLRPFASFHHIIYPNYKSLILFKFCSTLNSLEKKEIHPSLFQRLLPRLKLINFPYIEYLKATMQIANSYYNSILLYCALYFDNNKTENEYQIYFKQLAILSRNLFRLSNSSPIDIDSDDDDYEVYEEERFTEQRILRECSQLLNSPEKADAWIEYLNIILMNEQWDTLIDFTACLHHLLISGNNPVHHYRIFLLLTNNSHCLKGFWQCISQLKRSGTLSHSVPLISILARGMLLDNDEASQLLPLLTMFSYILKFYYSTMTDEEFYAEEPNPDYPAKPFTLAEMVSLSKTLKDIAVGIILLAYPDTHDPGTDQTIQNNIPTSNANYNIKCWTLLMQEVIGLVSLLNARDLRKPFTKEGHWLSNFISVPDTVPVYNSTKSVMAQPFTSSRSNTRSVISHNVEGQLLLSIHESRNVCLLTLIPFTIAFLKRFSILQNHFDVERFENQNPQVHYLQAPPHYFVRIRRHYLYEDAFEKLSDENAPDLKLTVKIKMVNKWGLDEAGVDGGGVFREFITELLKTAFDPNRGFFICTNDNELYPNPNVHVICPDFEKHYFFIGRILGKAIYEGIMAEIPLTDFFLAKLTGDTRNMYLNNLASLDHELYKNIMNLRRYKGDFAEMGLDFTIYTNQYGQSLSRELKPNGGEIPVTADNVAEYIDLIAKFKMHEEISKQTEAFKEGLQNVFSLDWLKMFSPKELQIIISGDEAPIDITDMKMNTVYAGGYSAEHPCIIMFWNILDSFNNVERSDLLRFITSCPRPPLLGFKELQPPICIQHVEGVDGRFPTSSTCMNLLKLPAFSDESIMRSKLLYAIQSGAGFELS
ncbi:ubiquitin-protein ligase E3C-like isoform X2 [Cimex lectularius]|uniref:Ubiquitin-protein ligase E3C n=1 Tax=Cimex lectularius TaxID=79782 RepID=A0A8I6TEC1_CIMLE|nr:ubiquitin-protein ligase E3C-like isoform X2 [Cimex lectularius]